MSFISVPTWPSKQSPGEDRSLRIRHPRLDQLPSVTPTRNLFLNPLPTPPSNTPLDRRQPRRIFLESADAPCVGILSRKVATYRRNSASRRSPFRGASQPLDGPSGARPTSRS